jgi:hypothetical protein
MDSLHVASPATIFRISNSEVITGEWLHNEITRFSAEDDVWTNAFLENIIFEYTGEKLTQECEIREIREQLADSRLYFMNRENSTSHREGPYFLHMGNVHPAYRLYPDTVGAFMVGTVPGENPFK